MEVIHLTASHAGKWVTEHSFRKVGETVRISNEQAQQIQAASGVKGTKAAKGAEGPGAVGPSDAVAMSSMGQDVGRVLAALSSVPEPVRADKVAALKAQIEAGTYHVPARDIAQSILRQASENLL